MSNIIYSDVLIASFDEFDVYKAVRDGTYSFSSQDRKRQVLNPLKSSAFSMQFVQGQRLTEVTATRKTLYNVLLSIGGLLNFVLKFSMILIGNRQHFAMATNFMRKIYSVDSKNPEDKDAQVAR